MPENDTLSGIRDLLGALSRAEGFPAAQRVFASTILGDRSDITEETFSKGELAAIQAAAASAADRRKIERDRVKGRILELKLPKDRESELLAANEHSRRKPLRVSYASYPTRFWNIDRFARLPLPMQLAIQRFDPALSALMTLGQATVEVDPEGNAILSDTYDFRVLDPPTPDPGLVGPPKPTVAQRFGAAGPVGKAGMVARSALRGDISLPLLLGHLFAPEREPGPPGRRVRVNLGKLDLGGE